MRIVEGYRVDFQFVGKSPDYLDWVASNGPMHTWGNSDLIGDTYVINHASQDDALQAATQEGIDGIKNGVFQDTSWSQRVIGFMVRRHNFGKT